ncbi:MAG: alkaline phosphatase [Prevotellaceae bacterium]|jgi:alkaline phosphatase|nr:alkaline phosphatase [Prevotellaceae bacterium]
MKKIVLVLLFVVFSIEVFSQSKQIKNVILMIPDGTSWATVSSARWYQRYNNPDKPNLYLDPYLCGTVLTFSSNAPIGDSAPTTSCYMTGVPSRAGYVATYPPADPKNDIVPLDSTMAYQPLMTILEAAKIFHNMATGLVFTCEFPHATPADCSAHSYNRGKYEWIAPQMAHNNIDVVIGGGVRFLNEESKNYLLNEGFGVLLDDINGFHTYPGNKMWSLFCQEDMPYDLDRDKTLYPSLAEMTAKAIEKLSKNENGFFLMVEGSKIDWAAHANDPIGMITDMLAFDEAFGVAADFAKRDGETIIIAVPDHGNSGISIGSSRCTNYSTQSKDDLFKTVSGFKATSETIVALLKNTAPDSIKSVFKQYTNIELSDKDMKRILSSKDYSKSALSAEERMKGTDLKKLITEILNDATCFGFTTGGHTGEEVFLAIYSPKSDLRPTGFMTNIDLNRYMQTILATGDLNKHTEEYFAKHTEVFKDYSWKINKNNKIPVLEIERIRKNKKSGNDKLLITPNSNVVLFNGKEIKLNSVVVYVDKTDTFYLPKSLTGIFN